MDVRNQVDNVDYKKNIDLTMTDKTNVEIKGHEKNWRESTHIHTS
jgi:hypothetical protein